MNPEIEGSAVADLFRQVHHLGGQPLGDLVALMEHASGIDVAVVDAGPDEHGLTMRDPGRQVVIIGVARTRHPMRQRSTLAHELGHVQFEDWAPHGAGHWSDRSPAEIRADAFARHLLLPQDGLRDFLGEQRPISEHTLSVVVQRFLVSPALAAIALQQAGYIDVATKQQWMSLSTAQLAIRYGWSDYYHALQADSEQRRAPQRLLARSIRAYVEGVLPARAIATIRSMDPELIEAELLDAGIVPAEHPIVWADPFDLPDVRADLRDLDEDLKAPDESRDASMEPDMG